MSTTIAAPQGRLLEQSLDWLRSFGLWNGEATLSDRALIWPDPEGDSRLLLARPADVPLYVEEGVADYGVVGSDVLWEQEPDVLIGPDLGFGRCQLVLAGPKGTPWPPQGRIRVATKFPKLSARLLRAAGIDADLVTLKGAVELAPQVGLADMILDLCQTGETLKKNDLVVLATLADTSVRLIANRSVRATMPKALRPMFKEDEADAKAQDLAGGIQTLARLAL